MARRSEKRSIFHDLVKDEVTLTQALYNFLRMECFKDVFIGLINEKREKAGYELLDPRKIKQDDFEVEVVLTEQKDKRVDLLLEYSNDEKFIFEIKINPNTKLTNNQPEGYLKVIDYDYKRLYFVLPRNYYHKNELYRRYSGLKQKVKEKKGIELTEEMIHNQILYWEDIAKEIKRITANGANPLLQEFYDILWSKWIGYEIVKFTEREIDLILSKGGVEMDNPIIPRIISKLFKAIDGVKAEINESKEYVYQNPDSYGYVLNTSSKRYMIDPDIEIFYGVDYEIWQKYNCPFVVEIYTDNEDKKKELEMFAQKEGYKEFYYEEEEMGDVWFKCLNLSEDEYKKALQEVL